MGFASWIKDARERDTEDIQDVVKKYYHRVRPVLRISLSLFNTQGYWLHFNLVYGFLVYCIVLGLEATLIFSINKFEDNVDLMIITCHHAVIGGFTLGMNTCFIYKRRNFSKMLEMMKSRLHDYKDDPVLHTTKGRALKAAEWFVHEVMSFFPILIVGFVFGVKRIFTIIFPSDVNVTETGINYLVAHPIYCPTEGFSSVFYVCEIAEVVFVIQSASAVASVCSLYVIHCIFLITELDYLRLSVANFESRVKCRLKRTDGRKMPFLKQKMQECASDCLVENIKHHHAIKKYFDQLNDMMSTTIFIGYGCGTFTMGLAMMKLFTKKENQKLDVGNTSLIGLLFMFEIVFMLVVSYFGEMITTNAHRVFEQLRFMRLDKFTGVKFRKTLLMFTIGMQKPMQLDAGGFSKCNMETFASVMNVAYSMLNIAAAAKNETDK
uniref:Odorant receptor n=1 Tax=Cyrtorhinus lividipennis TaxID=1032904 RepID=A0A346TI16_9HEMI|nr:odorant receptor 8 [Cyrtorhinus lividipennis]